MNFDPSLHGSYEYIHFTTETTEKIDLNRRYSQTAENLTSHTPNGLWLSVTGINDWEQYCLKNNCRLNNLKSEFQILLKPHAKILVLHNKSTFDDFENKYAYYPEGAVIHRENYSFYLSIKWEGIISDYQGIVIPKIIPKPYNRGLWYNAWCCTSGCIWDLQAVEKAVKLE